jgi:hypothetical protein
VVHAVEHPGETAQNALEAGKHAVDTVKNDAGQAAQTVEHGASGLFGGLMHAVEHPGDVVSGIGHAAESAGGAMLDAGGKALDAGKSLAGGVLGEAKGVGDSVKQAGKTMLGLGGDALQAVGNAVTHPADTAKTIWHDATAAGGFVKDAILHPASGTQNILDNPLRGGANGSGPSVGTWITNPAGAFEQSMFDEGAQRVGPTQQDLDFLSSHSTTTSYSTKLGAQARGRLSANLPFDPSKLFSKVPIGNIASGELRPAENFSVTRTVTMPSGSKPGSVSYTFSGQLDASLKNNLAATLKTQLGGKSGSIGLTPSSIDDLANATGSVTLTYNLTPQQLSAIRTSDGGDLPGMLPISNGQIERPDAVSATLQTQHIAPSADAQYRTDMVQTTMTATYSNPTKAVSDILGNISQGDFGKALANIGEDGDFSAKTKTFGIDGGTAQYDLGVKIPSQLDAKGWLLLQGQDQIGLQPAAAPVAPAPTAPPAAPPATPTPPQSQQVVVLPHQGLNIRSAPGTDARKIAAFTSGTFLQATGRSATDASGHRWVEVSGPDQARDTVRGWVDARYVTPHASGGEDATGRVDTTLRSEGYRPVTVRSGDTLDGIAAAHGADPSRAVVVNNDHVIDPNLIFPGDTVYLPSRQQMAHAP